MVGAVRDKRNTRAGKKEGCEKCSRSMNGEREIQMTRQAGERRQKEARLKEDKVKDCKKKRG